MLTCPPKKPGHGKPHKYGQKWPGRFATNHQKSSWSVWCWISGCVIVFIGDIWIKKTWRVIIFQSLKHNKIPELTPGPEAFYIFQHLDLRCQRAQQAFLSVDRMWPTHLREMTSPGPLRCWASSDCQNHIPTRNTFRKAVYPKNGTWSTGSKCPKTWGKP